MYYSLTLSCFFAITLPQRFNFFLFQPRIDQYFAQIQRIIQARITFSRVRFMMQHIVDLRENDWVSQLEDNDPKTIDQIRAEAAIHAEWGQLGKTFSSILRISTYSTGSPTSRRERATNN